MALIQLCVKVPHSWGFSWRKRERKHCESNQFLLRHGMAIFMVENGGKPAHTDLWTVPSTSDPETQRVAQMWIPRSHVKLFPDGAFSLHTFPPALSFKACSLARERPCIFSLYILCPCFILQDMWMYYCNTMLLLPPLLATQNCGMGGRGWVPVLGKWLLNSHKYVNSPPPPQLTPIQETAASWCYVKNIGESDFLWHTLAVEKIL